MCKHPNQGELDVPADLDRYLRHHLYPCDADSLATILQDAVLSVRPLNDGRYVEVNFSVLDSGDFMIERVIFLRRPDSAVLVGSDVFEYRYNWRTCQYTRR